MAELMAEIKVVQRAVAMVAEMAVRMVDWMVELKV